MQLFKFDVHGSVYRKYIPIYIQQHATFTQFIYIWRLLYMFRVVPPLIIRSVYNCIYSIWYLSHRYCYLLLSWRSWKLTTGILSSDLHRTFRNVTKAWFDKFLYVMSCELRDIKISVCHFDFRNLLLIWISDKFLCPTNQTNLPLYEHQRKVV
jgi:hypothetical protein